MIAPSTLDRIPFLRGASAGARRELAARSALRRFAAGEVLWTAGGEPRGLLVVLEGRVRGLVERLDGLAARSVGARLAGWLLGRWREAGGGPFTRGGTQAEVAEELGTVREVLVRELGRLREAGVVRSLHAPGGGVGERFSRRRTEEARAGRGVPPAQLRLGVSTPL